MKRKLPCFLILLLLLTLLPTPVGAVTTISHVSLTGLDYPVFGATPDTTVNSATTGCTIHSLEWYDETTDRFIDNTELIEDEHQYTAIIWVEAQDGYDFQCINDYTVDTTATVDGVGANVCKAYEYKAWAMVEVRLTFPPVPTNAWIYTVDLHPKAPEVGKSPDYTPTSRNQYRGITLPGREEYTLYGIAWMKDNQTMPTSGQVFEAGHSYTYIATIVNKDGFAFAYRPTFTVREYVADGDFFWVEGIGEVLQVEYTFPVLEEPHTHTPSDWRITQVYHYQVCTTCGEFLFSEDHCGGTETCTEPATCTVCGALYGEAQGHRWSPTFLHKEEGGHGWICADCHGISELYPHKGGTATCTQKATCTECGYSYGKLAAHTPGAAATETSPQRCTVCNTILTPAKNHTHNLTEVKEKAPTCTEPGILGHYACDGCSVRFSDDKGKNPLPDTTETELPPLGHQLSEDWFWDGQFHWRACPVCMTVLEETRMLHDMADGVCLTCGYDGKNTTSPTAPTNATEEATEDTGDTEEATEDTEDTEDTENPPKDSDKKSGKVWIPVAIGGTATMGAAAAATVILRRRRA